MPEIVDINQYIPVNNSTSWKSEILNMDSSKYITFTAFSDADYDIKIEYCVDKLFINIIDTDIFSNLGGDMYSQKFPIKTKYMRLSVENIAVTPNILCTSAFFWT